MSSNTWRRGGFAVATTGLALALAGCGGGDVEEISEGTPSEFGSPIASAPAQDPGAAAPAPAPGTPPADAAPAPAPAGVPVAAAPAPTAPQAPAAPAPAGSPAPAVAGSTPAPIQPAAGTPAPADAPAAPGAPADDNTNTLALLQAANTAPTPSPTPAPNAANTASGPSPGPGGPAAGFTRPPDGNDPASMEESMRRGPGPGAPPGPGGPLGGPGAPLGPGGFGDSGGGTGAEVKTNFTTPEKAVETFLAAVKARSLESLVTTVSRRSPDEAHVKTRPIFQSILERTITPDEIGDIATQLDGYKLMHRLPAQSTGRVEVMISKEKQDERKRHILYTRKVTTRREKNEWRILDISREAENIRNR